MAHSLMAGRSSVSIDSPGRAVAYLHWRRSIKVSTWMVVRCQGSMARIPWLLCLFNLFGAEAAVTIDTFFPSDCMVASGSLLMVSGLLACSICPGDSQLQGGGACSNPRVALLHFGPGGSHVLVWGNCGNPQHALLGRSDLAFFLSVVY